MKPNGIEMPWGRENSNETKLPWGCGVALVVAVFVVVGMVILMGYQIQRVKEQEAAPKTTAVRVSNIVAVVMHEPGQYTLLVQSNKGIIKESRLCRDAPCGQATHCQFVADVPPDKPMWAEYLTNEHGCLEHPIVHIHGGRSFTGGGWSTHDKFHLPRQSNVITATNVTQ